MAYNPGILTHWPWEPLGSFKYVLVAPGVTHSIYLFLVKAEERSLFYVFVFPFMLWRMLHDQVWISYARYRTAKGKNLIVDRGIDFEQVDRERNWDDQILLNWIILYAIYWGLEAAQHMPVWRMDGLLQMFILHFGPVEFLYYWLHRALHHHYLYSRYHSHHHSSIVTEPITSVIHPFGEHLAYFTLFAIPPLTSIFIGTSSISAIAIYITYIDLMNNMGHCNFEIIPKWVFIKFPPLKYLMYTPSYHSLHHTNFRTNYSLFVPFYDYIYGTMDEFTDSIYEISLNKREDVPDVVHLTHPTTMQSFYQLRLGFASKPLNSKWYLWLIWPVTLLWSIVMTWLCGRTFIIERNTFQELTSQSWAVPRVKKQVATIRKDEHEKLKKNLTKEDSCNLIQTTKAFDDYKVWLVGEDLTKNEQLMASKGTLFIHFSHFPPIKTRKDCFYLNAPAMLAPKSFGNLHSCENWLPRRVMSASRVAGIVHALEGWNMNECGDKLFNIDKVWEASLRHGFRPSLTYT